MEKRQESSKIGADMHFRASAILGRFLWSIFIEKFFLRFQILIKLLSTCTNSTAAAGVSQSAAEMKKAWGCLLQALGSHCLNNVHHVQHVSERVQKWVTFCMNLTNNLRTQQSAFLLNSRCPKFGDVR